MDINGANFFRVVEMMKDRLKANAVPIQIPIGASETFEGLVDLVEMKAYYYSGAQDADAPVDVKEIPADLVAICEEYREKLVEAAADADDELMMKYLEGEEVTQEELKAAIRKATLAIKMIPVVCGTSFKNKGVRKLLDAVVEYLPSPIDVGSITGVNPETREEEQRGASLEEPFLFSKLFLTRMESFASSAYIRVR